MNETYVMHMSGSLYFLLVGSLKYICTINCLQGQTHYIFIVVFLARLCFISIFTTLSFMLGKPIALRHLFVHDRLKCCPIS